MRARHLLTFGLLTAGMMSTISSAAHASNPDSTLRDGAWALQFRIADNFQLSSFKGSVLSVKHHHSDRSALRLGIGTSLSSGDQEDMREGSGGAFSTSGDFSDHSVSIDLQYLHYLRPAGWTSAFFGGGPMVAWSKREDELEVGSEIDTRVQESSEVGVAGTFGVEVFPIDNFGLHAEYGVTLGARTTEETIQSPNNVQSRERYSWVFQGEGVLFGASIYF